MTLFKNVIAMIPIVAIDSHVRIILPMSYVDSFFVTIKNHKNTKRWAPALYMGYWAYNFYL